jgi:hypothetical protein
VRVRVLDPEEAAMILTLHDLASREASAASRQAAIDESEALRQRIEAGYAKVDKAVQDGKPTEALEKARMALRNLEAELARKEQAIDIPAYFEAHLTQIARDALRWVRVPKGSVIVVSMPDVYDVIVRLDNLPEEPPF